MGGSLAGVMNRGPSRPVLTPVKPVNHDIEGAAFLSLVSLLVPTPRIRSDVYGVVSRSLLSYISASSRESNDSCGTELITLDS